MQKMHIPGAGHLADKDILTRIVVNLIHREGYA